jgi:tRNA-5-taurinomethyluridine 2-sulfurtransferase
MLSSEVPFCLARAAAALVRRSRRLASSSCRRALSADAAAAAAAVAATNNNSTPATPTTTTTTTAIPCAPPPLIHPRTGRPVQAAVALSGGVDSAVAALLARERFGASNVFCVWARTWDAGDEEGSGSGGSGTAPSCYGGTGGGGASGGGCGVPAASSSTTTTTTTTTPPAVTPSACESEADLRSAQRVAHGLGLPLVEADLRAAYWNRVFDAFLTDAQEGSATPNPDLACNSAVKFGALLEFAARWHRDSRRGRGGVVGEEEGEAAEDEVVLVTGHYARVGVAAEGAAEASAAALPPHPLALGNSPPSSARLLRARDLAKDQSYFLSSLTSEQLARSWFPIGEAASKRDVRALAAAGAAAGAAGAPALASAAAPGALAAVAERRSSAGICFVGRRRRFADFIEGYLDPVPGRFVCCETGEDLGACANLLAVTHGQRAPLEGGALALVAAAARRRTGEGRKRGRRRGGDDNGPIDDNPRWYVVGKDMERRVAHVAPGHGHPALRTRSVLLEAPRWVASAGGSAASAGAPAAPAAAAFFLPFPPGSLLQYKARYRQESPGWCRVRTATSPEAVERAGRGSRGGGEGDGGVGVGCGRDAATAFRASRFFRRQQQQKQQHGSSSAANLLLVAELSEPAFAATPGQAFVLYRGDECLGSATIAAPGRSLLEEEEEEQGHE